MKLKESLVMALQNIRTSKMRSFLTMLGIIIGIAAVMVIVGFGSGMERYMESQFESFGTDTLTVFVTGRGSTRTLKVEEMYEIVDENKDLYLAVSPTVSMSGGVKIGTESLSSTSVTGVGEDYFDVKGYEVIRGRNINFMDIEKRGSVCVVGNYIATTYFGNNAVGQTLRIAGNQYEIVGVLDAFEEEMEEGGTDDAVYIPYSTAARSSRNETISSYTVKVTSEDKITHAKEKIENELYEIFSSKDYYRVTSMSLMLDIMSQMIGVIITVLAVIAGISLVVGGIGIMNIMMVSVSERTREIGIRKALGAKERYILSQFVIEASVTSAIGGIFGILAGILLSKVATVLVTNMLDVEMIVTPSVFATVVAFLVSAAIGIIFGYMPAKKAARLNPIDALRY